jgi:hypothetical protein
VTPGGKPLDASLLLNPPDAETAQVVNGCVVISGPTPYVTALWVVGPTVLGQTDVGGRLTVGKGWVRALYACPFAASVSLDFDWNALQTVTLAGNVGFTTANVAAGRSFLVRIVGDAAVRTFTWPADWKWVGAAAPASLAANKCGLLQLWCFGALDSDVVARWLAEP